MAQIHTLKVYKRPAATWYEFDCNFTDRTGASYRTHLRLQAWQHVFPARLPAEVPKALGARAESRPPIPIRYDPRFPTRAWVENSGWEDENGLYWFSLLTLFVQSMVMLLFFLLFRGLSPIGQMPWWSEIYKALPLAVEAFWLLMMGVIDRVMDSIA